jgi:hypothetical protein
MRKPVESSRSSLRIVQPVRATRSGDVPNQLEALELRLYDGYVRIEEAKALGQDVSAWEEFWIDLLHQYEVVADGFPEAA